MKFDVAITHRPMQTFLPFPDFNESAACLDRQRLGKQRVETMQIMHALFDADYGWQDHPVTNMWRNHAGALLGYQEAVCREWTSRGYNDSCLYKTLRLYFRHERFRHVRRPDWFGLEDLHYSHRAMLLDKAKQYEMHHADMPHRPHEVGRGMCDGNTPHKPHAKCWPEEYTVHYGCVFEKIPVGDPTVPPIIPYLWPEEAA